jgi:hypothetical protein
VIQKAHFDVVRRLERYNLFLGVPVVVISATVGSSVFAALQGEVSIGWKIALASFSLSASVLAALQTFLRFAERLERHRTAGAQYGTLKRDIEFALVMPRGDAAQFQQFVKSILDRMNSLAEGAPPLPYSSRVPA